MMIMQMVEMHIKKNSKNKTMITIISTMIKIDKVWMRVITMISIIQMRSMVITARDMMIRPQMLRDLILPQ